jgi:probable HAF family extracellular repeat protein
VFLYENGSMSDLGALPHASYAADVTETHDINELGQVVGCSIAADGHYHVFSVVEGVMSDLGFADDTSTCPEGLNDSGQMIIESFGGVGSAKLYLVDNGGTTDLGTFEGVHLNNAGVIAGAVGTRAALYDHGQIVDLPSGTAGYAYALSIDDQGTVLGAVRVMNAATRLVEDHAALWILDDVGAEP